MRRVWNFAQIEFSTRQSRWKIACSETDAAPEADSATYYLADEYE